MSLVADELLRVVHASLRPTFRRRLPPQLQASVQAAFADYSGMWIGVAPLLAGAVILIFFLDDSRPPLKGKLYTSTFTWPELTFLTCLLLVPLAIIVEFMRSHSQYFPRYGIPAIFAVAVLVPTFVSMWTANSRRAAALCAVVFLFAVISPSSIARVIPAKIEPNHTALPLDRESPVNISQIQPQSHSSMHDGLTFLEMNHYENPEFLSRVYYLLALSGLSICTCQWLQWHGIPQNQVPHPCERRAL